MSELDLLRRIARLEAIIDRLTVAESGGGGVTGSGTSGTIAKFTGSSAIGNSIITESGAVATVTGDMVATVRTSGLMPFVGSYTTTASNANLASSTIHASGTIRRWCQNWYVNATNNSTNYWRISLITLDGAGTEVLYFTTKDGSPTPSPNTSYRYDSGVISTAITTSMQGLLLAFTKTGSPGSIYNYGPAVYVA